MTLTPTRISGNLLTEQGWVRGTLTVEGGVITAITPGPANDDPILPGFIDTHVHGGGGGDTMDGEDGIRTLARFHASHGTTTLLPTTITNPWNTTMKVLENVARVAREGVPGGADIPGAHLEGPFINPERLGAQPAHALTPTPELVDEVLALGVVRVVTLAPEVPGAPEAAVRFACSGVRVSFGHTAATYEDATRVLKTVQAVGGTVGGTHLYNAMGGLAGRTPGVVGALLADAGAYAEVILDLHHVHEGAFLTALAAKPDRLHLVTDAMRATGLGDGESELGGQAVVVEGGRARLQDGTLAGSVLTLDLALRNAVACGLTLEAASRALSDVPARYLGLTDRGRIAVGCRADLVQLDSNLTVRHTWVEGEPTQCLTPTH